MLNETEAKDLVSFLFPQRRGVTIINDSCLEIGNR